MKFNYIANDNQSKSMKNSDQVNYKKKNYKKKKLDETNWSSDFYSLSDAVTKINYIWLFSIIENLY